MIGIANTVLKKLMRQHIPSADGEELSPNLYRTKHPRQTPSNGAVNCVMANQI